MLALKGLVLAAAVAVLVAPSGRPTEEVTWTHHAAVQVATAHHEPKGKAKRLPRLRVVQVGARLHAHVTIAI